MLFKRSHRKGSSRHLRLRVESCVSTILDLNRRLGEGKIKPEVIRQFQRLRESIQDVSEESVDEKDIDRIEETTNQLLQEIRMSYGDRKFDFLHDGPMH